MTKSEFTTNASKTPAMWANECLVSLTKINGEYYRNKAITGRFIEYVRPVPDGLFVSQNFVRIRGTYYLCYALLFSTGKPNSFLSSPLHAGSRFDHSFTVLKQFNHDLGIDRHTPGFPLGIWSFGEWRSNTMANLAHGFELNDQFLFPFYRQALHDGKARLISLFEEATRIVPLLKPEIPIMDQASQFGVEPSSIESYPLKSAVVSAFTLSRGGHCWAGYGPKSNMVNIDQLPPALTVLHYADAFMSVRDQLQQLCALMRKL